MMMNDDNRYIWTKENSFIGFPYKIGINTLGTYMAYVGVSKHLYEENKLKKLEEELDCHGGVSYLSIDRKADDRFSKEDWDNFYWIGWDYAHAGDYINYLNMGERLSIYEISPKKWTIEEVEFEVHNVIEDLNRNYRVPASVPECGS